MKLEHVSESWLKSQLRRILTEYLDPQDYQFFFFGSRVKGDSFERSDIDIGVEGPRPLSSSVKMRIEEDLEHLRTLYKMDLVDFTGSSVSFKKEASKHRELI